MGKKTVRMNIDRINGLPNDRPVVYKILNNKSENIYTGVAGKGNVHDRLEDHLPGHKNAIPGASKVQIDSGETPPCVFRDDRFDVCFFSHGARDRFSRTAQTEWGSSRVWYWAFPGFDALSPVVA